jgi:serine/threonine-protein kinase
VTAITGSKATLSSQVQTLQLLPTTAARHTTVLPRFEGEGPALRLVNESAPRFEMLKTLGAGGMGEVELVHDRDIGRKVAIKHLLSGPGSTLDAGTVARFVDEVRIIGQLEHPNIVPVHDVGLDAQGRFFFVMKYVDGETLESIITKLAAGNPEYHRKYTFEARVDIFLGLLRALAYAHSNGIIHRDLKPANVMVGRFGEVMLMDWGIAKQLQQAERPVSPAAVAEDQALATMPRERIFTTRHGTLIGTPAYMSPEQASGATDQIDYRSDLYSACVLFHELLTLKHYLADKTTLVDLLAAVSKESPPVSSRAFNQNPHQPNPPAELTYVVERGLKKNRAERFQSVSELIAELEAIREGKLKVQCAGTFTKRMTREFGGMVDRHPYGGFAMMMTGAALVLFGLVETCWLVMH